MRISIVNGTGRARRTKQVDDVEPKDETRREDAPTRPKRTKVTIGEK